MLFDQNELNAEGEPIVLDDCPSSTHNSGTSIRSAPRCVCPRAQRLHRDLLARRRELRAENGGVERKPKVPVVRVDLGLPRVEGEAARRLFATAESMRLCHAEKWDPELWFPVSNQSETGRLAKTICRRCPIQRACAQAAEDNGWVGIWGATDDEERSDQRRQTRTG